MRRWRVRVAIGLIAGLLLSLSSGCSVFSDEAKRSDTPLAVSCAKLDGNLVRLLVPAPKGSTALNADFPKTSKPSLRAYVNETYGDAASRKQVFGELRRRQVETIAVRAWAEPDGTIAIIYALRFETAGQAAGWFRWESGSWRSEGLRKRFSVGGWPDADGWWDPRLNDADEISSDVLAYAGRVMVNIRYWSPGTFQRQDVQALARRQLSRLEC